MTDLFFRMARAGKLVYAVTESIPEKDRLEPPEFAGHWDPHVWGDPILWSNCIVTVVDGLSKADPAGAADYAKRGKAVDASYKAMKAWALKRIAEVPRSIAFSSPVTMRSIILGRRSVSRSSPCRACQR